LPMWGIFLKERSYPGTPNYMSGKDPVPLIPESISSIVGVYISHMSNLSVYCHLNHDK
jgi:hypothetical protein